MCCEQSFYETAMSPPFVLFVIVDCCNKRGSLLLFNNGTLRLKKAQYKISCKIKFEREIAIHME